MKEFTFLNTSFGVNEVLTISEKEIVIEIIDPIYGISKQEIEVICRRAIPMAFEAYNPNAFLHGLVFGEGNYSITFFPLVKEGKLVLEMGLYGVLTSSLEGVETRTPSLIISTPFSCREESYLEEDGDESYTVSKFYIEK